MYMAMIASSASGQKQPTTQEELSMKKILSAVLALAFTFVFGAAFAADAAAPAAAPAPAPAKKEVCKDKHGKEVKCPAKKTTDETKAK
jgi:Spy/CpxP family protein refolding chaperone